MKKDRIQLVDFLKGISILGIVLFHLIHDYMDSPAIILTASTFAGAGIHLFNVCSSFGLTLSYLCKPIGWKDFFIKRFAKIYIPYAIAITLYFVFSSITFDGDSAFTAYLSHIFLFKMFSAEYMVSFGGHFWYISTIFQFYFSFIFLMAAMRQIGSKKLFLCSCVISIMWITFTSVMGKTDNRIWNNFFLQYLWEYGLGILLGDIYYNNNKIFKNKIPISAIIVITIVSFVVFALTGLKGGVLKNMNDVFAFLAIGGIYYLIYKTKILNSLMLFVSNFSYELYLLHILVFDIAFYCLDNLVSGVFIGILALTISVFVSNYYSKLTRILYNKILIVNNII